MPLSTKIPKLSLEETDRFWSKYEKKDECWLWIGTKNKEGYGQFSLKNKGYLAHRIAYFIFNGVISQFKVINHICHNPSCVNPNHLDEVTSRENAIHANNHNKLKTHCPKRHILDIINSQGKRICSICNRERSKIAMRNKRKSY